jgi:hypothetical protein
MISLNDLLKARAQNLDAEQRRERVLPLRLIFPRRAPATDQTTDQTTDQASDKTGDKTSDHNDHAATPAEKPAG